MRIVAWDTETALIRPANLAPALVCVTYQSPGEDARIVHPTDAEPLIRGWLEDPECLLVLHNSAYDMAVIGEAFPSLLPLVFAAYEADRVTDTLIRAWLLDIASGTFRRKHVGRGVFVKRNYSLADLAKRYAGMELKKDGWRMLYSLFANTPLDQWEKRAKEVQELAKEKLEQRGGARQGVAGLGEAGLGKARDEDLRGIANDDPSGVLRYPLDDARATLAVFAAQEPHAQWLDDQYRQARAALWLHLSSCWGLRTDAHGVEVLRRETEADIAELEEELQTLSLVRPDGSRDTKLAKRRMLDVCHRDGLTIPRTATHGDGTKCTLLDGTELPAVKGGHADCEDHVCLDFDACEATEDDVLIAYANYSQSRKVLSNDVKALSEGVHLPIHTSYGLAETGRTTSSGRRS
jgi:hypothetical protein